MAKAFWAYSLHLPHNYSKMAKHLTPDNRLKKLVVIGDRVLIKLTKPDERTASGLCLPQGVQEKEKV